MRNGALRTHRGCWKRRGVAAVIRVSRQATVEAHLAANRAASRPEMNIGECWDWQRRLLIWKKVRQCCGHTQLGPPAVGSLMYTRWHVLKEGHKLREFETPDRVVRLLDPANEEGLDIVFDGEAGRLADANEIIFCILNPCPLCADLENGSADRGVWGIGCGSFGLETQRRRGVHGRSELVDALVETMSYGRDTEDDMIQRG